MQRVHFIAIGGLAMHNLAITLSKRNNYIVSGSDDEIYEPSLSRLKSNGLLPDKLGWHPSRLQKSLTAVILGMQVQPDNPELLRAKEMGLKIYSFPEYLFQQTRNKTRIVITGSHGKTLITNMIIHVLKSMRMDADFLVGEQISDNDDMVKLSYESRIAVFEGDERYISPYDLRPKFHLYKPHIAVITGIAKDFSETYPEYDEYLMQYKLFIDSMEVQGRLIYFEKDKALKSLTEHTRRDLVNFGYDTHDFEIIQDKTFLKTKKGNIPVQISGIENLQYLNAARLACKQIGVNDDQFYKAIGTFKTEKKN